ncbi:MAG: beta-lactamase family protein [Acetobacteraceae bacterium]|nr:beta-lactamase family protein [Acetobacteraceae bacterium]
MNRFNAAFALVEEAVAAGGIPGAVLGLLEDGGTTVRAVGAAVAAPRVAMAEGTVFDLASLTKVVFTTTAILRLVEEGRIGLDDPLTVAIPDLRQYDVAGAAERRLTFRQCLAHRTHLPAVEPLYTHGQDPQTLRAFILQREWRQGPAVYSDINFLLLGIAIERLTGRALGEQAVLPGFSWRPDPAACAATEQCTWRGRVMRGEVHDENAFAMGGAAGHAGLFGTAAALLGFARGVIDGSVLSASSVAAMREEQHVVAGVRRGLGWQLATPGWPGGDRCPWGTIGHTGFTGTGLWIDREGGRAWALLTNRVHPTRHRESGIAALRRAVGDALQE